MTKTRSGMATLVLGLVDGLLLGFLALIFFIPGLIGLALIVALTYAAFRSLPLVSGMLVGAGGVVGALLVRQIIYICNEPDRGACPPGGLALATTYGLGLLLLGLLLGGVAMRTGRLDD
jgi:chromate transport protein ChrA